MYGKDGGYGTQRSAYGDGSYGAHVTCESAVRNKLRKGGVGLEEGGQRDDIMLVTVVEQKYEPRPSSEDMHFGEAL